MRNIIRCHSSVSWDKLTLIFIDIGLGKTVQAVCAFILRNAIALSQDRPKKPTLIVSPNDAVLTQWHETLLKAGVETNKIFRFVAKKAEYRLKGEIFVLCNRYDLQTEVRHMWGDEKKKTFGPSALLPNAQRQMMLCLKNQYLAGKGKAKNEHIGQGDEVSISEVITDCLGEYMNMKRTYQTVCIDEAHFLKSLMTYWGCAAGMLGRSSSCFFIEKCCPAVPELSLTFLLFFLCLPRTSHRANDCHVWNTLQQLLSGPKYLDDIYRSHGRLGS